MYKSNRTTAEQRLVKFQHRACKHRNEIETGCALVKTPPDPQIERHCAKADKQRLQLINIKRLNQEHAAAMRAKKKSILKKRRQLTFLQRHSLQCNIV